MTMFQYIKLATCKSHLSKGNKHIVFFFESVIKLKISLGALKTPFQNFGQL